MQYTLLEVERDRIDDGFVFRSKNLEGDRVEKEPCIAFIPNVAYVFAPTNTADEWKGKLIEMVHRELIKHKRAADLELEQFEAFMSQQLTSEQLRDLYDRSVDLLEGNTNQNQSLDLTQQAAAHYCKSAAL